MRVGEPLCPHGCFSWLSGMVYRGAGQTSVFCHPHNGFLPSFCLLCLCFPFPVLSRIISTRCMWKSKTLALGPRICLLYWSRQGWRYFINLEITKNAWLTLYFVMVTLMALKIRSQVSHSVKSQVLFHKKNKVLPARSISIFHLHEEFVAIFIPSCSPPLLPPVFLLIHMWLPLT